MEKEDDPRVDELIGEAIRLMAEGGASAKSLAQFSVRFRPIVEKQLEPLPRAPAQDLEEMIRAAVHDEFVQLFGVGSTSASGIKPRAKGPNGKKWVRKNVQLADKRTSLSLSAELYGRLEERAPGEAQKLVAKFANEAPADHPNRSDYVEERVTQYLVGAKLRLVG